MDCRFILQARGRRCIVSNRFSIRESISIGWSARGIVNVSWLRLSRVQGFYPSNPVALKCDLLEQVITVYLSHRTSACDEIQDIYANKAVRRYKSHLKWFPTKQAKAKTCAEPIHFYTRNELGLGRGVKCVSCDWGVGVLPGTIERPTVKPMEMSINGNAAIANSRHKIWSDDMCRPYAVHWVGANMGGWHSVVGVLGVHCRLCRT